jgi:dihydroorotate dehydrogenase (fumarate)
LRKQARCSLAATGGVATPNDGIKALLAGADVVQMVSAILRNGPSYFGTMNDELRRWMESQEVARLDDMRGKVALSTADAPHAFERAQYIRTVSGWSSWLGYQAYVREHDEDGLDDPES